MKYRDPQTGEFKDITVKVADTLPVGSEVDYNGTTVPNGWEEVDDVVVTENVVSRNLFNINGISKGSVEQGVISNSSEVTITNRTETSLTFNGNAWRGIISNLFEVEKNTSYKMSGTITLANLILYAYLYDENKNYLDAVSIGADTTFTTTNTAKYARVIISSSASYTGAYISNLQIEKGTSATNYTPYLNMQELEKKTRITTGKGTINSDYISAVENNHWERCGNVVSYSFTMTTNGVWDNTTKFISGLPKAKAEVRFSGIITWDDGILLRLSVSENGEIANAYSNRKPEKGNVIEGHITYITDEEATI